MKLTARSVAIGIIAHCMASQSLALHSRHINMALGSQGARGHIHSTPFVRPRRGHRLPAGGCMPVANAMRRHVQARRLAKAVDRHGRV
jgi:hypothetical protein